MTTAEALAQSLLRAQKRLEEALARRREQLSSLRDELRRAESLPADAPTLERHCLELSGRRDEVRAEVEAFEAQRSQLDESLRRELAVARERLRHAYRKRINDVRAARVAKDFQGAVNSFAAELGGEGVDPARATPAQLRKQLPALLQVSLAVNERMRAMSEEVRHRYADLCSFRRRQSDALEREKRLEEEMLKLKHRLSAHTGLPEQMRLAADILNADAAMLERIKGEVLTPLLSDARTERQKGLVGKDPLWQLRSLQRDS
jgi:hypothetical protein